MSCCLWAPGGYDYGRLATRASSPLLWADPHQLHQVIVNLVTNAHHALREVPLPRRLTLTTRYGPRGPGCPEVATPGQGFRQLCRPGSSSPSLPRSLLG